MHVRNEVITEIICLGLAEWKRQIGYHSRSKYETGMSRWKTTFGERLSSRLLPNQQAEAHIRASCLNQLTKLGMPKVVKRVPKYPCNKVIQNYKHLKVVYGHRNDLDSLVPPQFTNEPGQLSEAQWVWALDKHAT